MDNAVLEPIRKPGERVVTLSEVSFLRKTIVDDKAASMAVAVVIDGWNAERVRVGPHQCIPHGGDAGRRRGVETDSLEANCVGAKDQSPSSTI